MTDTAHPTWTDAQKAAVERPVMRSDDPTSLTTPLPRLALRIGLTGHRPGRLKLSLDAVNRERAERGEPKWTYAAFEERQKARIEAALLSIEHEAVALAQSAQVMTSRGKPQALFRDEPPLLRLVAGAALGADALAGEVVATRLKPQPGERPRAAEWRLDQFLPAGRTSFALDAAPDVATLAELRGSPIDVGDVWESVFARADSRVCLPASWRMEHGTGTLLAESEGAEALITRFGAPDHQPSSQSARHFTLDHVQSAEFLLRQIDILLALWDGQAAAGPGGTADIVARAIDAGVPVFLIETDKVESALRRVQDVTRSIGRGDILGWYPQPLSARFSPEETAASDLRAALAATLELPDHAHKHEEGERHGHGDKRSESTKLADFLAEPWPEHAGPKLYDLFVDAFSRNWTKARSRLPALNPFARQTIEEPHWTEKQWRSFITLLPVDGAFAARLKQLLHRRFVAADLMAVRYADFYRDAFVKSYLIAALAVIVAIVSLALPAGKEAALPVKGVLVLLELYLIGKIARKIHLGEAGHWHSKFVDYRALAESLRHMRFLAPFAEYAPGGAQALAPQAWWAWYLRATARELGLPHDVQLGRLFQAQLLAAIRPLEVEAQRSYHEGTHGRMSRTEHGLHAVGGAMFNLTMVMLAVTVVLIGGALIFAMGLEGRLITGFDDAGALMAAHFPRLTAGLYASKTAIGVLAAILPTIGAALTGIRFTADFDGKAERSAAMQHDLVALDKQLAAAEKQPDFDRTRDCLSETAGLLAEDVSAFLALYGRKQLTVPG